MNSSEEKAKEMYGKFYEAATVHMFNEISGWYIDEAESASNAKSCTLICVDEIIKVVPMYTGNLNPDWEYWQKVKEEIQKL